MRVFVCACFVCGERMDGGRSKRQIMRELVKHGGGAVASVSFREERSACGGRVKEIKKTNKKKINTAKNGGWLRE